MSWFQELSRQFWELRIYLDKVKNIRRKGTQWRTAVKDLRHKIKAETHLYRVLNPPKTQIPPVALDFSNAKQIQDPQMQTEVKPALRTQCLTVL